MTFINSITGMIGMTGIVVEQKNRVEYTLYKKLTGYVILLHKKRVLSSKNH